MLEWLILITFIISSQNGSVSTETFLDYFTLNFDSSTVLIHQVNVFKGFRRD